MNTETDLLSTTILSGNPEITDPPAQPPATTNGSPQRNALKLMDRVAIIAWMQIPENKEYVEKETDAAAALKATTDLKIEITPGNIVGIRNTLGIKKFKPAPAPSEASAKDGQDVDLITLQKQLTTQGKEIETIKIEATTTRDAYNLLVSHVRYLQLIILQNSTRLTALPESSMAEFKDLKPLAPLPALTAAPATAA